MSVNPFLIQELQAGEKLNHYTSVHSILDIFLEMEKMVEFASSKSI